MPQSAQIHSYLRETKTKPCNVKELVRLFNIQAHSLSDDALNKAHVTTMGNN